MIRIRCIKRILPMLLFLVFTAACQNTNAVVDVITFKPSNYNVLFFPNNSENNLEEIYMDALLELKGKYPNEFNEVEAKEKNVNDLKYTIKQDEPTLIIIKNGQTIAHLSGKKPKTEIIEQLEITMNTNKRAVQN